MRVIENNRGPFSQAVMAKGNRKNIKVKVQNHGEVSEEGLTGGKPCLHISKSVNFKACRTNFPRQMRGEFESRCDDCQRIEVIAEPSNPGIWFCLQCGYQGCGRYSKHKHALEHSRATRSDPHKIALNTTTWTIWCYECDEEVDISSSKRLEEAICCIRQRLTGEKALSASIHAETELCNSSRASRGNRPRPSNTVVTNNTVGSGGRQCVKGLSNLGNTCFFNAVLQSLAQTRELSHLLSKRQGEPEILLPGHRDLTRDVTIDGEDDCDNYKPFPVEALAIRLVSRTEQTSELTEAVVNLLRDMTESQGQVVNPRSLFSKVCAKVPRFKGYQQQDSHELLRNLLDGIKTEEHKKLKAGIVKAFNVNDQNRSEFRADKLLAERIKSYGTQALYSTVVDNLFGGYLMSTVCCTQCKHVSQMFEPFLDLSLPVYDDKVERRPPNRKPSRSNQVDDPTTSKYISKHQLKKQKNRRKGKQSNLQSTVETNGLPGSGNVTPDAAPTKEQPLNEGSDAVKVNRSSDNSPVSTPDENQTVFRDSNSRTTSRPNSAHSGRSSVSKNWADSEGYVSDSEGERCSDDRVDQDKAKRRMSGERTRLGEAMDSLKLTADTVEDRKHHDVIERSIRPLGSRRESHYHECSVESCLSRFTRSELLNGPNKFACDNCNKMARRKNGSNSNSKDSVKTIYCDVSRQLLVFSPPAILTLHLKRFQQHGFSLAKDNRHVTFDLVLDIAPYCSSLSTCIQPGQTEVKYLLFAVVEHSGRLSGGHYTAYVKVREKPRAHISFLQTCLYKETPLAVLMERMEQLYGRSDENGPHGAVGNSDDTRPSGWYHVSDSQVRDASEKQVLNAQAYLLLYERIL